MTKKANINSNIDILSELGYEFDHSWEVVATQKVDASKFGRAICREHQLEDGTILKNLCFIGIGCPNVSLKVTSYSPYQPVEGEEINVSRCTLKKLVDSSTGKIMGAVEID